jgi:iron complex outermembrane receptor protein
VRPDSLRPDSAQRIPAIRVEVTRQPTGAERVAWAVGAQDARAIRRGQATLGVDEALSNFPGLIVSNRYNYALDQRLSIRGAGSRANFGMRGVKVLLDGIPQSLPDGQSQLTNVDLGAIARVEVLRGSASSLYGNGSGGVLSFSTDLSARDPFGATLRTTAGSAGLVKNQVRLYGRAGNNIGMLSASRTTVDGFRQYSSADTRQLMGAIDRAIGEGLRLSLRAGTAETPHALNPGALTLAEFESNPDTAALNNVRRGARRSVSQRYASVRLSGDAAGAQWSAALFGQRRFVDNPLAVAPPGGGGPTNGTYNFIDRRVTGLRLDAARTLSRAWEPRVAAGLDLQRSYDIRRNYRATGGEIVALTDTLLQFQGETVTSLGPFAQLQASPVEDVTLSLGGRFDRLTFGVDDRFTGDGDDDSGERTMTAASGHLGAVWRSRESFSPYVNISTAFETPTTTELNSRPDGNGGFNPDLDPQRVRTMEVGTRGSWRSRLRYEASLFQVDTRDAIVQYLETAGRAYFRNAGRTRNRGLEVGVTAAATSWLTLRSAVTLSDYTFLEYRVPSATQPAPALDTLDGNRVAGVPGRAWRLGALGSFGAFSLDLDHSVQSPLWADDANTVRVPGWDRGQTNVRAAWTGSVRGWRVEPFAAVQNALDSRYAGAITLNGAFGRVFEPAPRRNWYAGLEVTAPILR